MNSSNKKGLGRGLSALFGDQNDVVEEKNSVIQQKQALIGDIERNKFSVPFTLLLFTLNLLYVSNISEA